MIVDFHAHVFPDDLAAKALESLLSHSYNLYEPVHNVTVSGLIKNMDAWNIDKSVVQPVITRVSQTQKLNEWAGSICSDRIVSFGAVHPDSGNYKDDIDFIVSLGLKGLKFHAEYQGFYVDEPRMLKIYDYALSKGLIILHHAGFDPAYPAPFKSTPKQFANIAKEMQGGIIIAAHLGGHDYWDDTEKYMLGTNIYMDTSMGFEYFSGEQFMRIVKGHGADKILFASDSPWSNAKTEMEHLKRLPLSETEIAAILGGNAKRILNL